MPHRIHKITSAHLPDPLINYGSTEFILEFADAAQLLQKWRNPQVGRSSREGTILSLAANARAAIGALNSKMMTTSITAELEEEYLEKLKIYKFLIDRTLPEALELVNLDQLLTPEDILEFIQKHIGLLGQEYGELQSAYSMLNQLQSITDIEIKDQFGRQKRISRSDVLDVIGKVLGNLLIKQTTLWPVDNLQAKPRGRIHFKQTYKRAIFRESQIPPQAIRTEDIRVIDKDRLSIIYFIIDMSQSMSKTVFKGGLTRLDGALLTSLGLYYYFKLVNRRKRREFDSFMMHIVPVVKTPYVISDNKTFEDYLLGAEAKGKTRLVQATHAAMKHAQDNYKNNSYDVQLVYLTDGRPNIPFEGILPGRKSKTLNEYFKRSGTKTPKSTQTCMIELHQIFDYLRTKKDRNWTITYFLMANRSMVKTGFFKDTQAMLSGITRPILIDPTEVDSLGKKILQETIMNVN